MEKRDKERQTACERVKLKQGEICRQANTGQHGIKLWNDLVSKQASKETPETAGLTSTQGIKIKLIHFPGSIVQSIQSLSLSKARTVHM